MSTLADLPLDKASADKVNRIALRTLFNYYHPFPLLTTPWGRVPFTRRRTVFNGLFTHASLTLFLSGDPPPRTILNNLRHGAQIVRGDIDLPQVVVVVEEGLAGGFL